MKIHELKPAAGSVRERKRIGRGHGSGQGKTAGKGHKGQWARSGGGVRPGFEGGQTSLARRIPKRGFNNIFRKQYAIINVSDLEKKFKSGDTVTSEAIIEAGLLKKSLDGIKILGDGELTCSLTISIKTKKVSKLKREFVYNDIILSVSAKEKIEKVGGKIESIEV